MRCNLLFQPGGAMAAVLGLSDAVIDEICITHCDDHAYVGAVNYNSPVKS